MKKKFLFILSLLIICQAAVLSQSDDKFINALRTCSPAYHQKDKINVDGINAISTKSMSGWQNGKCIYKETVNINGKDITTTCSFSKQQADEIVSVADAYYLTLQYAQEKVDVSSLDAVKNNPVFNVMNKYLQDSSVCAMSGL